MVSSTVGNITVPDKFPTILKSYVKDVVRTQPYDLLRWSATYFRCIANQVQPPVKCRLEVVPATSTDLTKGYLKTLIKQLGKGYYVNRDVLQDHWKSLCLPQDELWKYLSICRMLHWNQIHWLKMFAVMAASFTQDLRSTMILLCELLTDELEGGPDPIPLWIFAICYLHLAELDCSERQQFENGQKVLEYGELEPEKMSTVEPMIISTSSFRETIANEWKQCAEYKMATKEFKEKLIHDSIETETLSGHLHSRLSSDFRFGNYCDAIKQSVEFESIISILSDVEEKHLNKNEIEISETRSVINSEQFDDKIAAEESSIITEIGAPWSWMHQFATQNSSSKSYNFLEKNMSGDVSSCGISTDDELEATSDVKLLNNLQCDFNCVVDPMPGIGGLVSATTTQQFLNYLKYRSKDENGMVFPRHFSEENCPNMTDD